jgi:hypothetical protein
VGKFGASGAGERTNYALSGWNKVWRKQAPNLSYYQKHLDDVASYSIYNNMQSRQEKAIAKYQIHGIF